MNIALAGKKGVGKDTAGDLIINSFINLHKVTLASPLKTMCAQLFNISELELDSLYIKEKETINRFNIRTSIKALKLISKLNKDTYGKNLSVYKKIRVLNRLLFKRCTSYRNVLQFLGTDVCRNIVNYNIFIDNLLTRTIHLNKKGNYILVTDVRFHNEAEALLDAGFFTVLIKKETNTKDDHVSENSLPPDYEFDFVIHNDGSIGEYCTSVYKIVDIIKGVDDSLVM